MKEQGYNGHQNRRVIIAVPDNLGSCFPKRHQDAITTLLPDGFVAIMKIGSRVGYTLTPAAAMLWELSDGFSSLTTIISSIEEMISTQAPAVPIPSELRAELLRITDELIASDFMLDVANREPSGS